MGRRDAVQFTLEVVARARAYLPALRVTYEPGWMTRGNGTRADYEGAVVHHTASASSLARPFPTQGILRDGRPGLSGPLCNSAGPACTVDAPWLHITAAHPANHAGASGGKGTAPLPVTSLFNPRAWGHEVDYAGSTPMLPGQRLVAVVLGRAVVDVLGRDPSWVRAHAETSVTGKWDPGDGPSRTANMTAFRAEVGALTLPASTPGGFLMALSDEQQTKLLDMVARIDYMILPTEGPYPGPRGDVLTKIGALQAVLGDGPAAAAVAGALTDGDLARLAQVVNDERDRRERDGDPATGPRS